MTEGLSIEASVSVVIPSLNGAKRLPKLISALRNQSMNNFELIVVLDGSTDESRDLLHSLSLPFKLTVHLQNNAGRSAARNAGVKHSTGDTIVFYDDDMVPDPSSVERHLNLSKSHNAIIVGQQLESLHTNSGFGIYKASMSRKWVNSISQKPTVLDSESLYLTAANMSISREHFQMLNGFDDKLQDAEDFDLAVRAFSNGIKIVFDPHNVAEHNAFDSCVDYIIRQREYLRSHRELLNQRKDHPRIDLYEKLLQRRSKFNSMLYFLVPGSVAKLIDIGAFNWLPKCIRYPLYTRIISALSLYYPNRHL